MHPFIKLLTTAILILVLLSAGCTDTSGGSGSNPIPVGTEIPHPTQEPTPKIDPTPEVIPTPEPTDEITEWMSDHPAYSYTEIPSENNLFGIDMEMYVNERDMAQGIYNGFDENGNQVFQHQEHPNFDIYSELSVGQAEYVDGKYDLDNIIYEQNLETGKVALQIDDNAPVIMDADENRNSMLYYLGKAIYLKLI